MFAFNVVRFRVKPGYDERFVAAHRTMEAKMPGLHRAALVKTGDRQYCFVAEWDAFSDIVAARPAMIGILDSMRDMLEDLGAGLGVTDPVSGEVVAEVAPRKRRAAKSRTKKRAPAKARSAAARARRRPSRKRR